VINLSSKLETFLAKGSTPLLIDFYADWCAPCRAIAPTLKRLEKKFDDVQFGKLDIDEHPKVADKYGVKSIPMLVLVHHGKVLGHLVGVQPEAKIAALLEKTAR